MPLFHVQIEQALKREKRKSDVSSSIYGRNHVSTKLTCGPFGRSDFADVSGRSHAHCVADFHVLYPARYWMR